MGLSNSVTEVIITKLKQISGFRMWFTEVDNTRKYYWSYIDEDYYITDCWKESRFFDTKSECLDDFFSNVKGFVMR